MQDISLVTLVCEFSRQDPFRALGVFGLACVAISMTSNFDLLQLLGLVDMADEEREVRSA